MSKLEAPPADAAARIELLDLPVLIDTRGERLPLERKAAALLAILALDGARLRVDLAGLLWPEVALPAARNSLRQRVFRLQRMAGVELVVGGDRLRLAESVAHDLVEGSGPVNDPRRPVAELLGTLDYSDAPALHEWVSAARERLRRRQMDRVAELASAHEQRGEIAAAIAQAQRLVAADPLLEHAHRRLMRLHYLRGDRGAALAAYEQCRRILRDELGASPDPETGELARTIASAATSTTARPMLARPPAPPVAVLRPPRLCGRDAARAQLASAIAARGVLLLHGEAGIGKSRLLEDAAESRPGLLVAGGLAGDSRVPGALLARLAAKGLERSRLRLPAWAMQEMARLLPTLGPPPGSRLEPLRLQQAFALALRAWAEAGATGLLVDDLHHADEASLECLLAVAATHPPGLAWVFAVRTHEMPVALTDWLARSGAGRIETLQLESLDAGGVAELLRSLALERFDAANWTESLARHSGGNPLFALETLRALLALGDAAPSGDDRRARLPVPAALDALIERRLAGLSEAALRLARVAALAGSDFDADTATQVLDAHPLDIVEPWRELEQAQLLQGERLAHDLIAEATARALPADIARVLHARLAVTLESLGRGAARVAPHWAAAESWSRAGDSYAQAARDAQRASRRSDEMHLWEAAAANHDRAGQAGRAFDARADSVECVIMVRGVEAAMALADRLDADQRTEPQRMRALTVRATACLMAGRAAAGEEAARTALEAATRLDAHWPRFEASRLLAVALSQAGRAGEALQTIEPFREFVEREGDVRQRHHFWADYAYALKAAQRSSATAAALRKAMLTAQELGDFAELATLTSNLALVEGNLGRVEHALDHARRARSLSDPLGIAVSPAAGAIELYVSLHEAALGRYSESLAGFERAERCFGSNPGMIWISLAANHKASVLVHLGQFARARQTLQYESATTPATAARRHLLQARIARALGRSDDASIEAALTTLGPSGDRIVHLLTRIEATLTMPADDAARSCAALADEADGCEQLAIGMRARVFWLHHLTRAGALAGIDIDAVAALLRERHPADTYLPEAWWIVSQAFDAQGRRDDAEAALRHAFEWVSRRALPNVPPAFRDSFLHRNAANLALLAAAANRLGLRTPAPAITAR